MNIPLIFLISRHFFLVYRLKTIKMAVNNFYPKEPSRLISPFKRKLDKCCDDILEKEEEIKRLKRLKDKLLQKVYDPIFEMLFGTFGKEVAELIIKYNPQKWCMKCCQEGRLRYHYYDGCNGMIPHSLYTYTWITLGPVVLTKIGNTFDFDESEMLKVDIEAIRDMDHFRLIGLLFDDGASGEKFVKVVCKSRFAPGVTTIERHIDGQTYVVIKKKLK